MEKVNLQSKAQLIKDFWSPKILGDLNGQQVKLVKVKGEFVWHHHDNEAELFLVVSGNLKMEFHDSISLLAPGEFIIVPPGVEHRPSAVEETVILLFEPASTLNTGNLKNDFTKKDLEQI